MATEPTSTDDLTAEQKLGLAFVSLLTPVAGYAMGGKKGAMAGAAQGFTAAGGAAADIGKEQREDKKQKAAAEAAAQKYQTERKDRIDDAITIKEKEAELKPKEVKPVKNAKGQILDANSRDMIDSSTTPVKQKPAGTDLDLDKKKEVETLSTGNAKKRAIVNQIRGQFEEFKKAKTEDDKIRIGRQMLKVLNSTEGADAISSEEAQRLGNALEYQKINVLEPGPVFGRDLDGFSTQVGATIGGIDSSVSANQARIDELLGRTPAAPASPVTSTGQVPPALQAAAKAEKARRGAERQKLSNGVAKGGQ